MTKHELGQKHICTNCGARFYDLMRTPPTCPSCETVVEAVERPRPTRSAAKAKPKPVKAEVAPAEESKELLDAGDDVDADVAEDDDTAEDMIEDVTELGEDEADMAGVVSGDDETT